jgi:signal transduction histidine kinase
MIGRASTDARWPVRAWRRLNLRWRLLVIGCAGLSVGLLLGGWLLLLALDWSFDRSVDTGAKETISDVADLIAAGQLPQPVPVAGVQLVQVVDSQDRVRAGSPGVDRLVPLLRSSEVTQALSGRRLQISGSRVGLDGPLRVSAAAAGPVSDRLTIVVAAPLNDAHQTIRDLRVVLLVVFYPLIVVLAVIAWWVIGATLQPVEALRAGAEEITGRNASHPDRRLPVPAGGDEIHRLAVTLNGMLDRLELGRRRQRRFVADAAHELRNPLAGMRTQLEVAQRHPETTDWRELTEDLLIDTQQLAALADDLLLLAGMDESGAALKPSGPVPVEDVFALLLARYREARVPVRCRDQRIGDRQPSDDLTLWANPEDVHRLMTNLLDNAVRHARSKVWLEARAERNQVLVAVIDDGPGIPATHRDRVFERFARLEEARTIDDGGAGLGLAIVAELVRRHGGTIRLSDAEGDRDGDGKDGQGDRGRGGGGDQGMDGHGDEEAGFTPGLRVDVLLPSARQHPDGQAPDRHTGR